VEFEPGSLVVIHARYAADAQTIDALKKSVTPEPAEAPLPELPTA
jgi:hypothetical protein